MTSDVVLEDVCPWPRGQVTCEVLGLDRVVLGLGSPRPWILRCPRLEDSIFLKIQLCDCFHKTQAVLRKNGPNNDNHRYLVS